MAEVRPKFADLTLDELTHRISDGMPGSIHEMTIKTEFLRRQTLLQEDVSKATARSAFFILLSVIAIAFASIADVVASLFLK